MPKDKDKDSRTAVKLVDGGEWKTLLFEVESRIETVNAALAELRLAVSKLAALPEPAIETAPEPFIETAPETVQTSALEAYEASMAAVADDAVSADEEAAREEVRRAVDAMRSELHEAPLAEYEAEPALASEAPQDDEAAREEVRRAVEAARAELSGGELTGSEPELVTDVHAADPNEDAAREEVRRAVEAARADLSGGELAASEPESVADEPAAGPNEDAAREAVRRAVEAARAELGADSMLEAPRAEVTEEAAPVRRPTLTELFSPQAEPLPGSHADAENPHAAADRWQKRHDESVEVPGAIVIEDEQGRVELSRVYDALSRVDCASQAALLNYTPHSVTVGLGPRAAAPAPDDLKNAVESIFGLPCRVSTEGSRITVHLGEEATRGAA